MGSCRCGVEPNLVSHLKAYMYTFKKGLPEILSNFPPSKSYSQFFGFIGVGLSQALNLGFWAQIFTLGKPLGELEGKNLVKSSFS